ncbi:MAG TPA: hypothetical protein PKA82_13670 [Pyrinomonadaceae bacterium]|nr:hypothetical protein [Pyrinomonadaceae bacterium]
MYRITALLLILAAFVSIMACGSGPAAPGSGADSPTEAYKRLYAAVKSKNTEQIKGTMTQKSLDFAEMVSGKNNTPIEKVFENGFTATTFSEKLPEIRDERIKDGFGSVEVWNAKESRWEDLPFINVDGAWKFAMGELFAGSFVSPGKGRDMKEKEAANALSGGPQPANMPNAAANSDVKPIVPKPATVESNKAADAKK